MLFYALHFRKWLSKRTFHSFSRIPVAPCHLLWQMYGHLIKEIGPKRPRPWRWIWPACLDADYLIRGRSCFMERNIFVFSLRLSTMITINLRLQAIKTAFSEGAKRHALPPGAFDLSLSGDNSNAHPPYVKVRQLCIILMVLGVRLRLKWRSQSKMSHEKRPEHLPAD